MQRLVSIGSEIDKCLEGQQYDKIKARLKEVRDGLEIIYTPLYGEFLQNVIPSFVKLLTVTKPAFDESDIQHQVRNAVLEILLRLPTNETLEKYAVPLMEQMIDVLQRDNEINGVQAVKIIMELYKVFKGHLESFAEPFLNFMFSVYSNFGIIADEMLKTRVATPGGVVTPNTGIPGKNKPSRPPVRRVKKNEVLRKSTLSCKVLTECPLLVVIVLQADKKFTSQFLKDILQKMVESFDVPIQPPSENAKDEDPDIFERYSQLITCQVKTASFFVFSLRTYPAYIAQFDKQIAQIVTNLLLKCPSDNHASRKDMLAIIRHIMDSQGTEEAKKRKTIIRDYFVSHLETLLDDKALLGSYQAYYASVRPIAYSTLADIIHNVREKLSLHQIYRTITFYTKVMFDPTVPISIQSMSAKLLAHLIETIYNNCRSSQSNSDRELGIETLMNILRLFVAKTKSLSSQIISIQNQMKEKQSSEERISAHRVEGDNDQDQDNKDADSHAKIVNLEEDLNHRKAMLRPLSLGVKNVAFVLMNLEKNSESQLKSHHLEITKLLGSLFKHGLNCIPSFLRLTSSDEDTEILKLFLAIFSTLAPETFEVIFRVQIHFIYKKIVEDERYLSIVTNFCANLNDRSVPIFCSIFLKFLVERMDELGDDTPQSAVLLKCFKAMSSTTSLFKAMKPSLLKDIVTKCLVLANESNYSLNYYKVLRILFRRLAMGNCEDYFRELIPTISLVLERLSDLMKTAFKSPAPARELYIELCLTTPAKLHILCPYLPLLVRPALYALQGVELTSIALRNLELWVKSLRRHRIEVLLQPVMPELIHSLFTQLKGRLGEIAMRILALLGGTNRKYLSSVPHINDFRNGIYLAIRFNTGSNPSIPHNLSLDSFVKLARRVLHFSSNRQKNMKLTAFNFLQNCVVSMLDLSGENLKDNYKLANAIYNPPFGKERINYHVNGFISFDVENQAESFNPNAKLSIIILRRLLSAVVTCVADNELKEEAEIFVRSICRHIALVYLSSAHLPGNLSKNSALDLFLDSLVDVFCFEPKAAQFAFLQFMDCINVLCVGNQDILASYGVWDKFRVRICHNCYQPFKKAGACQGIVTICEKLPKWWLKRHEVDFFRSLLFIIKDSIDQSVAKIVSEAVDALLSIFLQCHSEFLEKWKEDPSVGIVDENDQDSDAFRFFELVKLLVQELSNYNPTVRGVSQNIFSIMVEKSGRSVKEILSPFIPDLESKFVAEHFEKQSRKVRTGIVECLAYLLSLQPQAVTITEGVKRIVGFAQEFSSSKIDSGLNSEDKQILRSLRIGCLRLLTKYVNCAEVQEAKEKDNETRTQIVSIFFKYIESSDKVFIEIAKSGLKEYISKEKLSRNLLSQSLKPILHNVSKHTNLTESNLITLSHLLELCTSYFSPKLGDQLVNNLENWKQPNAVTHIQQGEETKIAAKIMDLFPLLPEGSRKSLPALCQLTLDLERIWSSQCSETSSCFRKPLAKFLNLYPQDAILYFKDHLCDEPENNYPYFRLLVSIFKLPESPQLREEMRNNLGILVEITFEAALQNELQKTMPLQSDGTDHRRSKGITLVYLLSKYFPAMFNVSRDTGILKHLTDSWDMIVNIQNTSLQLRSDHQTAKKIHMLAHIFINICRHNEQETSYLFRLLRVFVYPLVSDYSYLREFFTREIVKFSIDTQRKILEETIAMFEGENQSSNLLKVEALNYLFGTIIRYNFVPEETEGADMLIPDELMKRIFETLFNAKTISDDEAISIQILELATIFVRNLPNRMIEYRKEMMKMAYNRISRESVGKPYAFELAAYFIEKFDTPDKIIVQVYISLLRAHQPEGKAQVRNALDILARELAKKSGSEGSPKYVSWTKKVLLEEGHSQQQLVHLWSLFVRHPDIFYVARDFFIPKIVNSLGKIGNNNAQLDQKKLAIDLAQLILTWENRHLRELDAASRSIDSNNEVKDTTDENNNLGKRKREEFTQSHPTKSKRLTMPYSEQQEGVAERIISFLIKMTLYIHQHQSRVDSKELDRLSEKILSIFEGALQLWDYGKIKIEYIHKMLQEQSAYVRMIVMVLKLLEIILKYRKEFIVTESAKIYEDIAKYFKHDDSKLIEALNSFIESIFKVFPLTKTEKPPAQLRNFYTDLLRLSAKGFDMEIRNQYGHLALLQLFCHHFPHYTVKFTEAVHRSLLKMLNEHATISKESKQSSTADRLTASRKGGASRNINNMHLVDAILICIDFLSFGTHDSAKLKHFYQTVGSIIEKNNDINPIIVERMLSNLRIWLLTDFNNPTKRRIELSDNQKAFFVSALTVLENKDKNSPIKKQYHNLLLELFNDEGIRKKANSFTECVASNFVAGLKSEDPTSKKQFLEALNSRIGPTIYERLSFVFESKNWSPLQDTFWIRHALDIVIDSLNMDDSAFPDGKFNSNIFPVVFSSTPTPVVDRSLFTETEYSNLFQKIPIPDDFSFDDKAKSLLEEHENFLKQYREMKVRDLLLPLRQLGRESARLSYDLWIALFESAWSTLTQLQKDDLYESLISLLSSDYHAKQYIKYPNIVQALLEGIAQCKPKIQFSPEMLRFLGKSFNVWHIAIPMMEEELELMYSNAEYGDRCERFSLCLAELYNVLMEHDMLCGIWRNFDVSDFTKHALALEKYGMLEESQDVLQRMIEGYSDGEITRSDVSHFELSVWEDQWLATARRLQQWDSLDAYASTLPPSALRLQCFWMKGDWVAIRETLEPNTANKSQLFNICQFSASIMLDKERRDDLYQQATGSTLQRWCALPIFICQTHFDMLHNFQQLLELNESSTLLFKNDSKYHPKELEAFMLNWRDRVPNEWDDIDMWRDIIYWRYHFTLLLQQKFDPTTSSEQNAVCTMESMHLMNTLASVARKHGSVVPAITLLNNNEQFLKDFRSGKEIPEYGARHYEMLRCLEACDFLDDALHTIDNVIRFKKLTPERKLDILRVRGTVLDKLGYREEAKVTFSSAINLFPKAYYTGPTSNSLGRIILEWSKLLDDVSETSNMLEDRTNASVGYLQAIRFGSKEAISYMSRVFWLMQHKDNDVRYFDAIKRSVQDIAPHIWLPFVQQLNGMLQREHYGELAKAIFGRVTKDYIQAVFYMFRSSYFYLRKLLDDSQEHNESDNSKILLARVKRHHDELIKFCSKFPVFNQIQAAFSDISVRLSPAVEEELAQCLYQTITDCYAYNVYDESLRVPSHISKVIHNALKHISHQNFNVQFLVEQRDQMKADLMQEDISLTEFTRNLKKWYNIIQKRVNLNPSCVPLESLCPTLHQYDIHHVEIPGQYANLTYGEKPFIEYHDKILSFSPDVDIVRRYMIDCRKISIRSHTGKIFHFIVQPLTSSVTRPLARSEERAYALLNHLNCFFKENILSHAKYLQYQTPVIVPLNHSSRLIQEKPIVSTLEDIFYEHCVENKINLDAHMLHFWKRYSETDNRLHAFLDVKETIPKDILKNYINGLCSNWNDFFTIRQRFVKELSLLSIANHILNIQIHSPHKFLISGTSGELFQFDFRTNFNKDGTLRHPDIVPFKLTQNIQNFLGSICMEGELLNSFSVAARALYLKENHVLDLLRVYIRDEVSTWMNIGSGVFLSEIQKDDTKIEEIALNNSKILHKRLCDMDLIHDNTHTEWKPVNYEIEKLIRSACSDENLCQMCPTTYPFF